MNPHYLLPLYGALAALNIITIPAAIYYFYRCRMLESGIENALHVVKHYHTKYYKMAVLAKTLRDYSWGLVGRLNEATTENDTENI